jgi:hypothetical protein
MSRRTTPDNRLDIIAPVIRAVSLAPKFRSRAECEMYTLRDRMRQANAARSPDYTLPDSHLYPVVPSSTKGARNALETLARYFQREFGYDFAQYRANETTGKHDRCFLWTEDDYRGHVAVGGVCFRWWKCRDSQNGLVDRMVLSWVWVHPFLRGRGLLGSYWAGFRELYGDFVVESPLSAAMVAFLAKRGECWWCGRAHSCKTCTEPTTTQQEQPCPKP